MKFARELQKGDAVRGLYTVAEEPLVHGQWVHLFDEDGRQHTLYAYELVGSEKVIGYRKTRPMTGSAELYRELSMLAMQDYDRVVTLAQVCDANAADDDPIRRLFGAAALIRQAAEELETAARVQDRKVS